MDAPEKLNNKILFRLAHAEQIKQLSPCPRGQVGAVIFDPTTFAIISDGFNGPPRKGGHLCGGDQCNRNDRDIESGTHCEIGCHHAEVNALCNAVRNGHKTEGMHMAISCAPCLMCAKMIHHAGITKVYYSNPLDYLSEGLEYLEPFIHLHESVE